MRWLKLIQALGEPKSLQRLIPFRVNGDHPIVVVRAVRQIVPKYNGWHRHRADKKFEIRWWVRHELPCI